MVMTSSLPASASQSQSQSVPNWPLKSGPADWPVPANPAMMADGLPASARRACADAPCCPGLAELGTPRYQSLADAIAALLLDGRIAPDTALPSERELAGALGVSRSTTTAAYQRWPTDGLLSRRRGSGSFLQLPAGARVAGPGSRVHRAR